MPNIQSVSSKSLDSCRKELATLPAVIDMEPATYMLNVLTRLSNEFQNHVRGGNGFSWLIHQNRDAYGDFQRAIYDTTPYFIPQPDRHHINPNGIIRPPKSEDEEDLTHIVRKMGGFDLNDMRRHIERCDEFRNLTA